MGWKPGKFLKKAWKGVKKVVKKIGRGIKKIAKGFMKAIGKLGVVGQLGLMFFMPYAVSGISSMFGNMIGAAGKWIGATAKTLTTGSSFIGKAIGHTMNAIHTVGTKIGHVYSTITDTISGAVNSFADATGLGKGFDAVGKFFHEKVVNPTKQFFGFEASAYKPMFDTSGTVRDVNVDVPKLDPTKVEFDPVTNLPKTESSFVDIGGKMIQKDPFAAPQYDLTATTEDVKKYTGIDLEVTAEKPSLLSKIKEQTIDPLARKAKREVEKGLLSGVQQRAREFITGKPPTANRFGGSQYNFGDTNWLDSSQVNTWNGVFQQDQGNPWMAFSQQFYNDLQANINNSLQDDVYNQEISAANKYARQQQQYQPQPFGGG